MTKKDYLNMASDLRRSAYYVATGDNDKLVKKIMAEIQNNKKLFSELGIDLSLKRNLLAEELLSASQKIMRLVFEH